MGPDETRPPLTAPGFFRADAGRIDGAPVIEAMITRVHDRQEKWPGRAVGRLPLPAELKEDAILGSFSYALQQSHTRLLRSDVLISLDHTADTPPALARDYLTLKFGEAGKIQRPQLARLLEHTRPMPLYARPLDFREGFYVDVRGAFWEIMRVVGWQVDYYPGRWLARGRGVRDFPFQEDTRPQKLSRNSLVSAGMLSTMPRWNSSARIVEEMKPGNRLVNSQLVGLVRDVLHAIAWEVRRIGVLYVATDGYIASSWAMMEKVKDAIASWGLDARIKGAGVGAVYGPGSYRVGRLKTITPRREPVAIDTMIEGEYDKWLKPRFARLAAWKHRGD